MVAQPREEQGPAEPVVLVAAIGPYTAPIASLIWALRRERGLCVAEAFVVADRRGLRYVWADLLAGGAVLDQLREVLGPSLVDQASFRVRTARLPSGEMIEDDVARVNAAAFQETLLGAARDAIEAAGERRVVFGLTAGSRRTATAIQTAAYQLLGRPRDLLVDVRVDDPRVDEDTAFFFPEQKERVLRAGHAEIDARAVRIDLLELELPRLTVAPPAPELVIDLVAGRVTADGSEIDLSIAERFWYAYLAANRGRTADGWVLAGQDGHDAFREFLELARARSWARSIRTRPLRFLLEGEFVHDEDMRNLRGKTVQRLKRWCAAVRPELKMWVVPEIDGNGRQRLPLPASRITIIGLAG